MAEPGEGHESISETIEHWRTMFRNFSKHIQDSSSTAEESRWLLEVLQAVFGDKETIRQKHPYSFLVCPQSPLIIEKQHTSPRVPAFPLYSAPNPCAQSSIINIL